MYLKHYISIYISWYIEVLHSFSATFCLGNCEEETLKPEANDKSPPLC